MDAFAILGVGARFDKKKFKPTKYNIKVLVSFSPRAATTRQNSEVSIKVPEVDFFATTITDNSKISNEIALNSVDEKFKIGAEIADILDFASNEDLNRFRNLHRIKTFGSQVPAPVKNFQHLIRKYSIDENYLLKLKKSYYAEPTAIQFQAMPVILEGRDLIACAPTGSGKTVAFALPLLHKISRNYNVVGSGDGIRSLILAPTRELAQQIHREISRLAPSNCKVSILSKSNYSDTDKNYDILITTPLRLIYAVKEKKANLERVETIIVDEADKMFEMGFIKQLDEILTVCTCPSIQKALFSATITQHVEELAKSVMKDPVTVIVGARNIAAKTVDQKLLFVGGEEGKLIAMKQQIQKGLKPPVLIFVESIERAKRLFEDLKFDKINVDVIHSERSEDERERTIRNFRAGKIWILISTELLGRGLDFKGVNLVINYDIPKTVESYIHRIGRTGRAGHLGEAVTFFTKEDKKYIRGIANVMKLSGSTVPEWMFQMPKDQQQGRKRKRQVKNVQNRKQEK